MRQIKHKTILAMSLAAIMAIMPYSGTVLAESDVAIDSVLTDRATDVIPDRPDRTPEVMFKGFTEGWAIIGGQAYPASIDLNGNAFHVGNGVWKVKADAVVTLPDDKQVKLELKGKTHGHKLRLHGTGTVDSGEQFRIVLRGHFAPIAGQQGDFVLDFTGARIFNVEERIRIPLVQDGIIHVEPAGISTDIEEFVDDLSLQ